MRRCISICSIIFPVLFVACVKDTDLTVSEVPLIVVECILSDDPVQTLYLSQTKNKSASTFEPVGEADVRLIDLTLGEEAGIFSQHQDGEWTLDYVGIPGHSYRLEIQIPGRDFIYAEDTMPERIRRIGGYFMPFYMNSSIIFEHYRSLNFIPSNGYYFISDSLKTNTWVCGMNYNLDTQQYEIAENICTDYPYVDPFNLTGDRVTMIDEDKEDMLYPWLIGTDYHKRFLRLTNSPETSFTVFTIYGSFSGNYTRYWRDSREEKGFLLCMHVSDNYDRYLTEAIQAEQFREKKANLAGIYIMNNYYTNIIGGIGIFGTCTKSRAPWAGRHSEIAGQTQMDTDIIPR